MTRINLLLVRTILVPAILALATLGFTPGADAQKATPVPARVPAPAPAPIEPHLIIPMGQRSQDFDSEFSPDGKYLLTAGGRSALIWEIATGMVVAELTRPDIDLEHAKYTPDGKHILTYGDQTAALWDAATGQLLTILQQAERSLGQVRFTPDGSSILICEKEKANFYSSRTGELKRSLEIPPSQAAKRDGRGDVTLLDVSFSPDGKKIVFARLNDISSLVDLTTNNIITDLPAVSQDADQQDPKADESWNLDYSSDGRTIMSSSLEGVIELWSAATGRLIRRWKPFGRFIYRCRFSPDGKEVLAYGNNGYSRWSVSTGDSLPFPAIATHLADIKYNPTGTRIATRNSIDEVCIDNADWQPLLKIPSPGSIAAFSADSRQIALTTDDQTVLILQVSDGRKLGELKGHANQLLGVALSIDGKTIQSFTDKMSYSWDLQTGRLTGFNHIGGRPGAGGWDAKRDRVVTLLAAGADEAACVWDFPTGRRLFTIKRTGFLSGLSGALFDSAGTRILTWSPDSTAQIWDAATGQCLHTIKVTKGLGIRGAFSPDGSVVAISSFDTTVKVYEVATGKLRFSATIGGYGAIKLQFSPDGAQLMALSFEGLFVFNSTTGEAVFTHREKHLIVAGYSPDGQTLFAGGNGGARFYDPHSGKAIRTIGMNGDRLTHLQSIQFSGNGKKLVTYYRGDSADVWDAASTRHLTFLKGPLTFYFGTDLQIDSAGDHLIFPSIDNTVKVWDLRTGGLLYSFFAFDSTNYLVYDPYSRYDGTESARKQVYYTCGTEIVSLDQLKERIWVPSLVSRINNDDSINAPHLADLHICGLTPLVTRETSPGASWRFRIQPRAGGLGETALYVNGNETRRYLPSQLQKTPTGYALTVTAAQLKEDLVPGQDNPVTVKAFTKDNDLSSRGATIVSTTPARDATPPNLFGVMVGVSDYKGDELDLKYAAKDATDLSRAIDTAATKWLGRQHVFLYNLTTDSAHYRLPEKNAIRQTLEAIGKKATANDILLIFFAGHGVMAGGQKKQFYFLTADASASTATGEAVREVGISAAELTDWIQPANIKAQKRILILDACNSGQAINDIVRIGQVNQQYAAARNDDKAEEVKSIDKLNERSGLFILAASAGNQSAYEMSRYSQGLLTYALLKAIKEDPTILEKDKYLNIAPWFDHARNTVIDLVRDNGARQDPQLVSTTNFDIGIVDSGVIAAIHLAAENPLFTASNFQNNDETVGGDDLELTTAVNRNLSSIGSRGAGLDITYTPAAANPDAWHLIGRYAVSGTTITVTVNVWQNKKNLFHFPVTGTTTNLNALATDIIKAALNRVNSKK